MKLTKRDIVQIYNTLAYFKTIDVEKPKGYVYKAFKNLKLMQTEIDALSEIEPKIFKDFQSQVNNLLIEYTDKDLNGHPVTKENSGLIKDLVFSDEKLQEVNKKINELSLTIDREAMAKEQEDYDAILDEEIDIELLKFNEGDLFDGIKERELEILGEVIA